MLGSDCAPWWSRQREWLSQAAQEPGLCLGSHTTSSLTVTCSQCVPSMGIASLCFNSGGAVQAGWGQLPLAWCRVWRRVGALCLHTGVG